MQPKTNRKITALDQIAFKQAIKNTLHVSKGIQNNPGFCTDMPLIVGLKLTNRCNLRCKHCYEWNDSGYHQKLPKDLQEKDMELSLIKKILNETKETKSNLYLWGGEPLYYNKFNELSYELEHDYRITAICTNGQLIEERMESLLRMDNHLELLIAIDGLEKENDAMRGENTFHKVMKGIQTLLKMRKRGIFSGKISIHCVINHENAAKLYDFCEYFENIGVDTIILCYPWYISIDTSEKMDLYYKTNIEAKEYENASWHAFKYQLAPQFYQTILKEKERICSKRWSLNVKFQPELSDSQILIFLNDELKTDTYQCYSIANRMEVLPDGCVSTCKHFPEMTVGNICDHSLRELWHCEKYHRMRVTLQKQLMPVCTKCNNLYLHGRKILYEKSST